MTKLLTKYKDSRIFITVLLLLTSTTFFSQTKDDYLEALKTIKKGFNDNDPSLIHNSFNADLKLELNKDNLDKMIDSLFKENGKMQSYDLIMEEEKQKNYLVEFENSSLLIAIEIDKERKISTLEVKNY